MAKWLPWILIRSGFIYFCPVPSHPLVLIIFCMLNVIFPCPSSNCCDPDSCPLLFPHVCLCLSFAVCQMYPGLEISHVEEASSPATIQGWCKKGLGKCQTRPFIVVPYRCLGESQTHPEQFIIPDIPSRML